MGEKNTGFHHWCKNVKVICLLVMQRAHPGGFYSVLCRGGSQQGQVAVRWCGSLGRPQQGLDVCSDVVLGRGAALRTQPPAFSFSVALRIPATLCCIIGVIFCCFPFQNDVLATLVYLGKTSLLPAQNLLAQWRSITLQHCIHVQKCFL